MATEAATGCAPGVWRCAGCREVLAVDGIAGEAARYLPHSTDVHTRTHLAKPGAKHAEDHVSTDGIAGWCPFCSAHMPTPEHP
eukprot:359013-Chlamydomonas_euryale.AAC.9